MLLGGHKLHPLWYTGWIPLLFLISCISMGYAIVVWESAISSRIFKRERETRMLASLAGTMIAVNVLFLLLRFGDILFSGKAALMFTDGFYSFMFWLEIALFAIPIYMFSRTKARQNFATIFRGSLLMLFAGALYRFDAYIIAYNPGPGWSYFPTLPELLITLGVIALEITLYIYIVKRYPILGGVPATQSAD
jgi:Ni/Fe-hydrogenase subunit HybB-like protein